MTSLVVIIEVKLENHLKNDKKSLVPHDQNSTFQFANDKCTLTQVLVLLLVVELQERQESPYQLRPAGEYSLIELDTTKENTQQQIKINELMYQEITIGHENIVQKCETVALLTVLFFSNTLLAQTLCITKIILKTYNQKRNNFNSTIIVLLKWYNKKSIKSG